MWKRNLLPAGIFLREGFTMAERGGSVRQVNIEVPVILWAALDFWASFVGKTKKEIIIQALTEYMEREGVDRYVKFRDE